MVRTAFGALGIAFLIGGPAIAVANEWGVGMTLMLGGIGAVSLVIATLMFRINNDRS